MLSKIISAFICKSLTKHFQRLLYGHDLTIRSYCHKTKKLTTKKQIQDSRKVLDQTGTDSETRPQVRVQHNWLKMFLSCRYCLSMGKCHSVCGGLSLAPATISSQSGRGFSLQHISPAAPMTSFSSGQSCIQPQPFPRAPNSQYLNTMLRQQKHFLKITGMKFF